MSLEKIGNIQHFENPIRSVKPARIIRTPNLMLKAYDMYIGEPSSDLIVGNMDKFLVKEILDGKIDPKSGLGFAILSKDMLNVARWDSKYPIVVVNSVYEFPEENRDVLSSKELDIGDIGAYCVWELGIVNHERIAWMKYLNSQREAQDKINYLQNWCKEGLIK